MKPRGGCGCQEVSLERSRFLCEPRRRLGLLRVGKQGGAGSQREGVGNRHRGAQRGTARGPARVCAPLSNFKWRGQPLGICLQPCRPFGCRAEQSMPSGGKREGETGRGPVGSRD